MRLGVDAEFLTKTETAFQNTHKNWQDLHLGTANEILIFGFKGLLHSVICKDGFEEIWLKRVNEALKIFSTEKLDVADRKGEMYFLGLQNNGEKILIEKFLKDWIYPLINEKKRKIELLSPIFERSLNRIKPSLEKIEEFSKYLDKLSKGVRVYGYKESENDSPEVKLFFNKLETAKRRGHYISGEEPTKIIMGIEKGRLKTFLGAENFEFKLQ